ncbi:zinc-binding dehydrogenase [Ensifer sp. YR511]|uniref:zinc-binding dehydrogenase n=1 Tax=Ensifer sp. YR511 TaxID=1855294 RepID=UPI00088E3A37|nr:zinc-binding dehydrogenase [Ensifer sp. YR511]SDN36744.1 Threonine dehydrogenase [Ensifer sp. YR511]
MPNEIVIAAKQAFELASYEDLPLKPGEVRGRTLYTLVSQGTELGWANGDAFPIRPGYAAVFRVDEVAQDVVGIRPGELRFAMGAHRATQTHLARYTLPLPADLEPGTATLARLMGVSMTTLMTTKARAGDRVVITGAGPVGFIAAHLFKIGGYRVTVVDPDELRRAQLEQSGLSDCRERMPLEDDAFAGKVALVVDCSGHENAVLEGCRLVRRLGEVVMVGVPWRKWTDASAHELMNAVFFNLATLRSGWEWEIPIQSRGFQWEELLEGYNNAPHSVFSGFSLALDWLAQSRIPLNGLIRRFVPNDPSALYSDIAAKRIEEPFIVLDWARLEEDK